MLSRTVISTLIVLLLCPLWLTSPLATAADIKNNDGGITLDFKDIELTDLIQTISALTGKNFVYDDGIRGKATIISSEQMTPNEAYKLFLTVLNIKGYTVVPAGKTNKIVATKMAMENNLPVQKTTTDQDQFVTRMIALKHIDASTIASSVLSPLMPKTSNIAVYEPSNMLIITDNGSNIARLVTIIKELDVPNAVQSMRVIALKHANAKDVAAICNEIIKEKKTTSKLRTAKNVKASGEDTTSKVIADERTNHLIVMATEEDLSIVLELLENLDQQLASDRSHINLYYLENADAETLGTTLNEIITGLKTTTTKTDSKGFPGATQALKSNVTVTADKPTNALIVNATPEDYVVLKEIIAQLDIRRKQVYVEALIMELSMDATEALGMGLQGAFEAGSEGVVSLATNSYPGGILSDTSLLTTSVSGIMAGGFSKLINYTDSSGETVSISAFSALLNLSKTDSNVNILSAPRLLTSDNEEAEIVVGSNVPIITSVLTDTGSSSLAQSVSVERKDVALTLRFTPQITEGNLVRLNVYQETTAISETSVGNVDYVGPTFTTRKISNTVLARNGQTVVLGGLISTTKNDVINKVPFLGDIPLLGWLFKSTTNTEKKTNLLVFITPTIIKDIEDLSSITLTNRLSMNKIQAQDSQPVATEKE
jgi:general secretion pathway protein D